MLKPVCQILVLFLLGWTCLARAGELRLGNGAILPGELVGIGAQSLVWRADKVGAVTIAKSDVLALQTSVRTSVEVAPDQVAKTDCLVGVVNSQWSVECGDQQLPAVAFDELRSLPPTTSSSGKFTAALDIDRGGNPSEEVKLDLVARWLRPGYRHNVDISIDYETSDGNTTDDDADANYQYDLLRDMGWYWFGRTRYYRDKFEAIEEVYALSAGIGREFSRGKDFTLSLQGGPAYMYYNYNDQGWEAEPGGNVRWTAVWNTPWRGITAYHTGELGWIFSVADAYLFQSKTALTFPLYKGLVAELRLEYDRTGATSITGSDYQTEWVLALGYHW